MKINKKYYECVRIRIFNTKGKLRATYHMPCTENMFCSCILVMDSIAYKTDIFGALWDVECLFHSRMIHNQNQCLAVGGITRIKK